MGLVLQISEGNFETGKQIRETSMRDTVGIVEKLNCIFITTGSIHALVMKQYVKLLCFGAPNHGVNQKTGDSRFILCGTSRM